MGWLLVASTLGSRKNGVDLRRSAIAELGATIILMSSLLIRRFYIRNQARIVVEGSISSADYTVYCYTEEPVESVEFSKDLQVPRPGPGLSLWL